MNIFPQNKMIVGIETDKQMILKVGFTLIELLVTIAIFMIITAVILVNNGRFNNAVIMTNIAYELALSIREAQSAALNVRLTPGQTDFNFGYGVHIDMATGANTKYILFADKIGASGEGTYSVGTPDFDVTEYKIKRGYFIKSISTSPSGTASDIDFTFKRPNPEASIKSSSGTSYNEATICIGHPNDTNIKACVKVNKAGLINVVENP